MCGIVGAVAQRNIVPVLVEGLRRLEYRGYDSCGVAVLTNGEPRRARSVARVADLDVQVREGQLEGVTGIAHTRWATHGAPVTNNAHPHFSSTIRARARAQRHHREPRTSCARAARQGLCVRQARPTPKSSPTWSTACTTATCSTPCSDAVEATARRLRDRRRSAGTSRTRGRRARRARRWSSACGEGENFLASDAMALAGVTDQIVYLEEGDVVDAAAGARTAHRRSRRHAGRARSADRASAQRRGRTRPVPALHAEGNLRAAARDRRHARRRDRHRCRSCSATGAPRVFKRDRHGADPGLRHELLPRLDREVLARDDREDPDAGRDRERIPLPRQRAEPEDAGRRRSRSAARPPTRWRR